MISIKFLNTSKSLHKYIINSKFLTKYFFTIAGKEDVEFGNDNFWILIWIVSLLILCKYKPSLIVSWMTIPRVLVHGFYSPLNICNVNHPMICQENKIWSFSTCIIFFFHFFLVNFHTRWKAYHPRCVPN